MGSSPKVPTYNQNAAIAEQNRINQAAGIQQYANVSSPLGGYTTSIDPVTGQITINKNLSDTSTAAQAKQLAALQSYTGDPTEAANAYYNAQMAYLQPQLDRQVERTESSLTNRGLPLGSNAWNNTMSDLYDTQNRTLSSLSNQALAQGQQYQTNILNQAGLLGGQVIDPSMIGGQAGAGLSDTYDKVFDNQVEKWKEKKAQRSSTIGNLMSLGGTALGAVAGSIIPGAGTLAGAQLGGMLGGAADNAMA